MSCSSRPPRQAWTCGTWERCSPKCTSGHVRNCRMRTQTGRALRLVTTFQGAGVLNGDLTPECAAAVTAVLDALSAPAGAEDDRTRDQRYHDALQEAMR